MSNQSGNAELGAIIVFGLIGLVLLTMFATVTAPQLATWLEAQAAAIRYNAEARAAAAQAERLREQSNLRAVDALATIAIESTRTINALMLLERAGATVGDWLRLAIGLVLLGIAGATWVTWRLATERRHLAAERARLMGLETEIQRLAAETRQRAFLETSQSVKSSFLERW